MRSASSLETHQEERNPDNKQNGTIRSSRSPSPLDDTFVRIRKPRKRQDERVASACTRKTSASGTLTARSYHDPANPYRDISLCASLSRLHLGEPVQESRNQDIVSPTTPSYLPKPVAKEPLSTPVQQQNGSRKMKNSLHSSRPHSPTKTPAFLSKTSNLQAADWDANTRWITMNKQMEDFREEMQKITNDQNSTDEQIKLYKTRSKFSLGLLNGEMTDSSVCVKVAELEAMRSQLVDDKVVLKGEIEEARVKLHSTTVALEDSRRTHSLEADDLRRKNRNDLEDLRDETRRKEESIKRDAQDELESLRRRHATEIEDIEKRLKSELEEERGRRISELEEHSKQITELLKNADSDASSREREVQNIQSEIGRLNATVEQEKSISNSLRERLGHAAAQAAHLESELEAAKAKSKFLESDSQAQSQAFADLNARMQQAIESATEANEKLRKEETLRRKLHNQVQELKGNIRVFCRVRPTLEAEEDPARIAYPDEQEDCKEILVTGPEKKSAIGNDATSKHSFSYDHVFGPNAGNGNIFEEISQLVQSALDGYNVCIFCYGQTGSGKTYTMSSEDGMIPLAVKQIYDTAHGLEEKGWKYTMQGSFVEVYNENLNDLLGKADDIDKKKLEIRHDNQRCKTTITDVTEIPLDSPSTVTGLLNRASTNRSVAATKANERSSRSHSVFILKLTGENSTTGERSEGTLNLVDLAGSERLAHSGATGERLKETQSINRSLSCLGDVIGALGQGKDGGHIPYRNSKLTYLLQHSLGGNSKTLMFVMISPLMAHLGETLTSLKFATKVHNTHIGTAKKQTKVKE